MKYGNVSHTLIKIPKFFYGNKIRSLETFSIPNIKKHYYKEKDLEKIEKEINFNHNHRIIIPWEKNERIHYSKPDITMNSTINSQSNIKIKDKILKKYEHFKKHSSYSNMISDSFKYDVKNKNNHLLNRIQENKAKYLSYSIVNNYCYKDLNIDKKLEGEDLFHKTLRDKVLSLSLISDKTKMLYSTKNWSIEWEKTFEKKRKIPKFVFKKNINIIHNNGKSILYENNLPLIKKNKSLPNVVVIKKK